MLSIAVFSQQHYNQLIRSTIRRVDDAPTPDLGVVRMRVRVYQDDESTMRVSFPCSTSVFVNVTFYLVLVAHVYT